MSRITVLPFQLLDPVPHVDRALPRTGLRPHPADHPAANCPEISPISGPHRPHHSKSGKQVFAANTKSPRSRTPARSWKLRALHPHPPRQPAPVETAGAHRVAGARGTAGARGRWLAPAETAGGIPRGITRDRSTTTTPARKRSRDHVRHGAQSGCVMVRRAGASWCAERVRHGAQSGCVTVRRAMAGPLPNFGHRPRPLFQSIVLRHLRPERPMRRSASVGPQEAAS